MLKCHSLTPWLRQCLAEQCCCGKMFTERATAGACSPLRETDSYLLYWLVLVVSLTGPGDGPPCVPGWGLISLALVEWEEGSTVAGTTP